MPTKKLSLAVYIGRFQPLHKGHLSTLKTALLEFDYVLVLIGSAQESRTCKNPWNYSERKDMLKHVLTDDKRKRVKILALPDFKTDTEWLEYINKLVASFINRKKIQAATAIGYTKDKSSYYLKLLSWPLKEFKNENFISISSTVIREKYFSDLPRDYTHEVPKAIADWLNKFKLKHPRIFKRLNLCFMPTITKKEM